MVFFPSISARVLPPFEETDNVTGWRVQLQRHFSEAIASIIYKCLHGIPILNVKNVSYCSVSFLFHPVNLNPVTPERDTRREPAWKMLGHHGYSGSVGSWFTGIKPPSLAQFGDFRNQESNPRNRTHPKY